MATSRFGAVVRGANKPSVGPVGTNHGAISIIPAVRRSPAVASVERERSPDTSGALKPSPWAPSRIDWIVMKVCVFVLVMMHFAQYMGSWKH